MGFFAKRFKKEPKTFLSSFKYAIEGIKYSFFAERNMQVHVFMMIAVIILGFVLNISILEWIICFMLIGAVIALELVNTAVEVVVDMITKEIDPLAKVAKDTAAGAVLVMAIVSGIIGSMIFGPKILDIIGILL